MIRMRLLPALAAAVLFALPGPRALAHDPAPRALSDSSERAEPTDIAATFTGSIHELVIDDPARGASERHVELRLDDGTLVPLRSERGTALIAGSRVEVTGHRNGKLLEVETARTVVPGGITSKANAEIEGTLAVLHADDFAAGHGSFVYEVHAASGTAHRLRVGALPSSLAPGMRLRVVGRAEANGESMTPDRITILDRPASIRESTGATAKAATASSVLVVMANFNNTAVPPFTAAQAQQVMTTNAGSVANFFRETSYGQQLMNVTVTPVWVAMNRAQPTTCGSSDWSGIGTAADAAAKMLGAAYDPASYNFVVYVFPKVTACGWTGLAYIGFPHKAWINGVAAFSTPTIAHEIGHNFGLLHAGSLRCGGSVIGGSCSVSEYGDPFDAMGNQRAMHYSAMQKAKLAWIPATSVKSHAGGSATYTLTPVEVAGGATYAIKIPTASADRTYWVEFRQPIGFDAPLSAFPSNGAEVRVSAPFETLCAGCDDWSNDTQLLDMTPGTSAFTDATLAAGQVFSDPANEIDVTVVSASASALTVQVAVGGASGPSTTTTALTATPNPSLTGATITFTAALTGSAPTGTVRFTDNGAAIAGCDGLALTGSGGTRSASCATNGLVTGTHAIVAAYSGDAGNAASTSATLSQVVNAPINGTNVALASNGGVASASSIHDAAYAADGVNDNRRSGAGWGAGGGWNDGTAGAFPDWVQIRFNAPKTIDHVVVYSVQDDFLSPVEPTDAMTFTRYGLTDFQVQAWNGTGWVTLGSVRYNNLVKRTVSFDAYTTDRIRISITGAKDALWSRVTEVEAWSSSGAAPMINYALASNGGTASASSIHDAGYSATGAIDNRRSGSAWGAGGGWNDGTPSTFPDWLVVKFSAKRTINHVVVYSVQDSFLSPLEPTDAMTFSLYGLTEFQVQGWNGASWVTLASVATNRYVKRVVSFTPYATDRIRIYVTRVKDGLWSRITEVEAWGN
jgi:hypothetical protein